MVDQKISELTEDTTPALTDEIATRRGGSNFRSPLSGIFPLVSGDVTIDTSGVATIATGALGRVFLDSANAGASASSITLSSLAAHNEYEFVFGYDGDGTASTANLEITFNSDTGSNYEYQRTLAHSSTTIGGSHSNSATSIIFDAPDRRDSGSFVIRVSKFDNGWYVTVDGPRDSVSVLGRIFSAGVWKDTSQITSIDVAISAGTMTTTSVLKAWGINDS